jgi:uncharacterized repeat protein (TIGR03803 family)
MKKRFSGQLAVMIVSVGLAWQAPARAQKFSVLYNFGTHAGDPEAAEYEGIVAQGRDGNLYSTTVFGGASGFGAVFKITARGTLTVLHSFDSTTEANPLSGLTLGTDGDFYGTTTHGGTFNMGTVFKVRTNGVLTVLYNFTGGSGANPYGPPIECTDGNFYGTTDGGGTNGLGTVYKLTPLGELTMLYSFDNTHGRDPVTPLVQGTNGNLYGTTSLGGTNNDGVIFSISQSGKFTVLYNFDGTHGAQPFGPLVQGSDGNFYGTTLLGGAVNFGAIFKMTAAGKLTVLHSMNGTTDGGMPDAGLVQGTDGNFYGANADAATGGSGTIFRISPTTPYRYKVLYNFNGTTGGLPEVTLLLHTDGILYADTQSGGTAGWGTFYGLNIGLKPFVSLVSPSGKIGKTIGILGQGFKGTMGVSFNGTPASFKVVSTTYLTAKVPGGATSGFVTVTTPKGKLTSNKKFRIN